MSSSEYETEESGESELSDTDAELQTAFQNKQLQPGLFKLVPHKERIIINNIDGMQAKLKEFTLDLPWIERLDVFNELAPLAPELAKKMALEAQSTDYAENEFKREINFYRQAQAAVLEAIPKINTCGVKTKRPVDYFAQMAKSDDHMKKVRELLLNKQTVMERKEKLKKLREMKKYGKQVQQEVLQKRREEKKEMLQSVQKFRKSQKNKSDEFEGKPTKSTNKKSAKNPKKSQKKAVSRKEFKDKKFGFGGQKKKSKFNDKKSAADVSDFYQGKNKSKGKSKGGFSKKSNKKNRRSK